MVMERRVPIDTFFRLCGRTIQFLVRFILMIVLTYAVRCSIILLSCTLMLPHKEQISYDKSFCAGHTLLVKDKLFMSLVLA